MVSAVIIIGAIVAAAYWVWLQPEPAEQPVTLEFWAPFGGEEAALEYWNTVSDAFYNETGVTVEIGFYTGDEFWTKLASGFAAGDPPDLFITYGGGELDTYVAEGQIADISDLLAEDWALAQITPAIKEAVTRDGKQYALPYEFQTDWIFINRKIFDQVGVSIPSMTTSWTWTEFIVACDALKAAEVIPIAMSGSATWSLTFPETYIFLHSNGAEAFQDALDRKVSFEPYYVTAFTKIKEWVDGDYFQLGWETAGYMDAYASFSSGESAMWMQGTFAIAMSLGQPALELDVVRYPYFPDKSELKDVVFGGPTSIGVAAASEHTKEAEDFLRFISKPDWQIYMARETHNPLAQSIALPAGIYPEVMVKCMDATASASIVHLRFGTMCSKEMGAYLDEQNLLVFTGQATPEGAAAAIEAKAVELIGPVTG